MKLFNTHRCEMQLYEDDFSHQCELETQTRCDVCRHWCCVVHREELKNALRKKVTLCMNCLTTKEVQ